MGAKCFLGYRKEYVFELGGFAYYPMPWMDPVADKFLGTWCRAALLAIRNLARAETVYNYEVSRYRHLAEQEKDPEIKRLLLYEAAIHVLHGDRNARIVGP